MKPKHLFKTFLTTIFFLVFVVFVSQVGASTEGDLQNQLISEKPQLDTPQVIDSGGEDRLYDIAEQSGYVAVGGSFTTIISNGITYTDSPFFFIYNQTTGQLHNNVTVDGVVEEIIAVSDNEIIIAGRFKNVNGEKRDRIAKVNIVTGELSNWNPSFNGRITSLALHEDRLFVGGNFTAVNAVSMIRLAEVSVTTGVVNTDFNFPIEGEFYSNGGPLVRKLLIAETDLGLARLVVVHRAETIAEQRRETVAIINIWNGTQTLSSWNTDIYHDIYLNKVQDADISPDGSTVVLANSGGDGPPDRDTLIAFDVTGFGDQEPVWVSRLFDSVYAVAVSDTTVYAGGHFCWVESEAANTGQTPGTVESPGNRNPESWAGKGFEDGIDHSCLKTRNGSIYGDETVYRFQIAAFNLTTGGATEWNPTAGGFNGVRMLEIGQNGLYGGSDGNMWGGIFNIGRYVHFPLETPANPPVDSPQDFLLGTCEVTIQGTTASVTVNLVDAPNKEWVLRRNNQWISTNSPQQTNISTTGSVNDEWIVRQNANGIKHDQECDILGEAADCSINEVNNQTIITWDFTEGTFVIRKNGNWLGTVTDDNMFAVTFGEGTINDSYVLKVWDNGTALTYDCI